MEIRFSKIAAIEFRHDYFLKTPVDWNAEWPALYTEDFIPQIFPTPDTHQRLANFGLRVRKTPKGFDIYAEVVEDAGKLLVKKYSGNNFKLAFYCEAPTASWWNITRASEEKQDICYFSNLSGFKSGGSDNSLYLHDEIPTSAAGSKKPSSLVRKGTKVYEALQLTNSQPPGAHWNDLGTHKNYSTLKNQKPVFGQSIAVSDASLANKTIQIKDVYGAVVFEKTIDVDSTLQTLNVDIKALPDGIYTLLLDAVEQLEFYHTNARNKDAFGLIELFFQGNQAEIPAPLQLANEWLPIGNGTGGLDAGEINPRTFVIHFLHNRAKWKYILSKDLSIPVPDVVAAGYQKLDATTFLSNQPLAITKTAAGADFGLDNAFPAPGIALLKTLKNGSDQVEFYVSEIFVNV